MSDDEKVTGEPFALPPLDGVDDLSLPQVASQDNTQDDEKPDVTELLDDVEDEPLDEDDSDELTPEEEIEVEEVAVESDDADFIAPEPEETLDDELEEDTLSDDAQLRAIFRAREAHGDNLPEDFSVPSAPTAGELFDLDQVLIDAVEYGASDVHITPNDYLAFTRLGEIQRMEQYGIITGDLTESLLLHIVTHQLEADFVERLELDTSYVIHDGDYRGRRFRLSVGKSFGEIFYVFRVIADSIPTLDELDVSDTVRQWSSLPNGLVMMNGPTGTGKALALSTPIPTPHGFTTMGEISIGDEVYDSHMQTVAVTGLSPIDSSPELYRVRLSDGQTIIADVNHQWIVSTRESRMVQYHTNAGARIADRVAADLASRMLLSVRPDVEFVHEDELYHHITGAAQYFYPTLDSVKRTLRFMDVPYDCDIKSGRIYHVASVLKALERRLRQRYEYTIDSPLRVLTVGEMLDSSVPNGFAGFGIPVAGDTDDWLFIESIERVEPDDEDYEPVRCMSVSSEDHSYLCADHVVTHNSTTLASLLNNAINERAQKVVTVERPIEYTFSSSGKGYAVQREVGQDTRAFSSALDSAMRQAPDIIMIGESRNHDEIDQVLRAAESGHLTMTTMHTNSAAATINRIKSLFEGNEQQRILATLSDVSRGFANQVLVKSIDGQSRFAIREVLEFDSEVSNLVANGDVRGIRNYQVENHLTMEDGLVKAVVDGRCTREAARAQSAYPLVFDKMLKDFG